MMWLKIKNIITQILFKGNLIKFIWIIAIVLQVRDVYFGSQVSPIISVPDSSFSVLGLGP